MNQRASGRERSARLRASAAADRMTLIPTRNEAGNGTRTRDPNLGKVVLYQLSYSRNYGQSYRRQTALTSVAPLAKK